MPKRPKVDLDAALREHLRALGRRGGKKRMAALTPEERSELGRAAIAKRWAKVKRKKT